MKDSPIPQFSRNAILRELESASPQVASLAILSAALYQPDRAWMEGLVADGLVHTAPEVRRAAAIAAGHLARIHGGPDVARLVPLLNALRDDPLASGAAEDALSDIAMFVTGSAPT